MNGRFVILSSCHPVILSKETAVADLTPRQIVQELDRYIVGQAAAKRAVAVAIRNRWRRQQLPLELRKDVTPKYTEVGYVGRDVESMVRDLAEAAVSMVKQEQRKVVEERARERVTERLLDLLLPASGNWEPDDAEGNERRQRTRDKMKARLEAGDFEERKVELQ